MNLEKPQESSPLGEHPAPAEAQPLGDGTVVRPYRAEDRPEVRRICADTGWLGEPIDGVFQDRELFADFLTTYYLDYEPDSCWVAERDGRIVAYAMGSVRPERHRKLTKRIAWRCGLKGAWRLLTGRYNRATRKFIGWILFRAGKEEPEALPDAAHMHWNMLPEARGTEVGKCFLESFVRHARASGMKKMYGHMTIPPGKRSTRIFERMGWQEIDRKEQTKFRGFTEGKVYTITLFRPLDEPTGRARTES
ncbi:MAG TPA: GNAT family N-acetyltransferase [Firmicutes bacterium]|nr:GNAT family N-acetyltransferase [Bacillota bacterium]